MKVALVVVCLLLAFVGAGFLLGPPGKAAPPVLSGDWSDGTLKISIVTEGQVLRVAGLEPGESISFVSAGTAGQWLENPPHLKVPRRLEWKSATAELELRVIDDSNSQSVVQLKKVP